MDNSCGGVSPRWLAALTIIFSAACAHSLGTKIHEHMTSDELLNVFHVDHPSLVPEYHLVQLTHHLARRNIPSNHPSNTLKPSNSKIPHEKTPTHKKNKWKVEKPPPSLLDDQMFKKARDNIRDVDIFGDLNNTVKVHFGDGDSDEIAHVSDDESDGDSDSEDLSDREHIEEEQDQDTHRIKLEAFGKELELVLKKQEGLLKKDGLKMWSLVRNETQPHGVDFEEMAEDAEEVGELYQDEESGAALLIRRDPGRNKIVVEGSIGHDLVIRPLPESLAAQPAADAHPSATQDDEMFLEPDSLGDMVSIDTGLPILRSRSQRERVRRALSGAGHVIIRREPAQGDHASDYAFMEPDRLGRRYRRRRSAEMEHESGGGGRGKREAPYVIYPEILVIVDYDGYRLHGGDNVQIKRYFVSFWNGVDLRYKLLKGPRIRISIAGIIISRGRDATPYLERNRVGRDAIDSAAALTDMGKYLFRERRLPVYDIAVAITKLDMCRRQFANDACNRGTAGFAYVGGACVVNKRLEKVNSVAIIEDTGGFSGIIVAAHEVGHLLGAVHDGSPPPSYLGGPGAEKCRWEDGFIMSDLRHTDKGFRWSPCSVQSFHHFLNGDTATCLYNSPHEDDSLPRVLPGRLLTLDAQCRKDRGTSACFKDERVCAQLFCFDAGSGYCVAYRPAAEGSPCGDGQYCINGRCIAEHENIIPDYSQHTPSYVRPETSPFYSNATSVEETTQPYSPPDRTQSYQHYDTTKPPEHTNGIHASSAPTTVTTANPYRFIYYTQSTTKSPYDFNYIAETKPTSYTLPSSSVTQAPYVYNKYSITSTKSPYDFHDFGRTVKTTEKPSTTASNPYEKVTSPNPYDKSTTRYNPYEKATTRYSPYGKSSISYNPYEKSTTYSPYEKSSTRYNPYDKSSTTRSPYEKSSTRYNPYDKSSTTRSPYEKSSTRYNPYDKSSTTHSPYEKSSTRYNPYDKSSTTRSPYEKSSTSYNPYDKTEKTTVKPKSGFYSKLDLDGFFNRTTTKSPLGLGFKENNVKTLYKIGTYYSQPNSDNAIRPDANSQQVQIEPARLVYSFQANVTNSGNITISCSGQDSYLRLECQTPKTGDSYKPNMATQSSAAGTSK